MRNRIRTTLAVAASAVLAVTASACSSDDDKPSAQRSPGALISADRCEQNKAAGEIVYLSGYGWQASASILEYAAAKKLGYFEDLCLNVALEPGTGDVAQNTNLMAAGHVTFSPVSQQDILTANANGIHIQGISSYSNSGLEVLMTMPDVKNLKQLDGTKLGQKGAMPVAVQAMMIKEGVDFDSVQQTVVGYDPSILPQGQVKSLTGFISNEPNQLKAAGKKVTVWRPSDYQVPSSLGSMAVDPEFATEHPTAVEDVLRAALHAYEYCEANAAECVKYTAELDGGSQGFPYDQQANVGIWQTEAQVVKETRKAGTPLGTIDLDNVHALADMLNKYTVTQISADDERDEFAPQFIQNIYDGDKLIWPAP
ncbi:ABC transporter substrate-binding protein [Symbioplanes lichenis]|uniref:ABC transporter substrate-binding protein n=1 Tax=Symbioplanes lichenis TaxID=1629072 RepID=UPI00273839B8|nr:ABC transporter substrate-binding protein [Actinoplanes lichenis]